ncbi:hypothetical protein ACLOJK_020740 [Asimina triloba]
MPCSIVARKGEKELPDRWMDVGLEGCCRLSPVVGIAGVCCHGKRDIGRRWHAAARRRTRCGCLLSGWVVLAEEDAHAAAVGIDGPSIFHGSDEFYLESKDLQLLDLAGLVLRKILLLPSTARKTVQVKGAVIGLVAGVEEDSLRSPRTYDHGLVIDPLDGFDHPIVACRRLCPADFGEDGVAIARMVRTWPTTFRDGRDEPILLSPSI